MVLLEYVLTVGTVISDPNDSRFDLEAYLNDLDAKTS